MRCADANGWCLCPYASEKGWAVRWSSEIFKLELINGTSSTIWQGRFGELSWAVVREFNSGIPELKLKVIVCYAMTPPGGKTAHLLDWVLLTWRREGDGIWCSPTFQVHCQSWVTTFYVKV